MANKIEVKRPSEKIEIGQLYNYANEVYVLASTHDEVVQLICINDGGRWNSGTDVLDANDITAEEFRLIRGNSNFERITYPITITPEAEQ